MVDFTIAIPTYNGAKRFPEVLDQLRLQTGSQEISWEVIVVDNNSTDNTAEVVKAYQANWLPHAPLRYCFEPRQGAGYARKLAVQEAQSDLIGFLDDDNLPALNWIAAAYQFAQKYPRAGAYASQIHGQFESPPPENLHRIIPFLAITERGSQPLQYVRTNLLPPSAGLVVRRQAWLGSIPEYCTLTGRINGNMLTGEDLEVLSYIRQAGWEIWYNPDMVVHHKIPASRLQKEYLLPFFRGIGLSRYVTRMLNVEPWLRPLATLGYILRDLGKIVIHLLRYGIGVKTDLAAACELELFLNSLMSPFYIWKKRHLDLQQ